MESSRVFQLLQDIEMELDKLSGSPEIDLELQAEKADKYKQLCEKLYSCAVSNNKNCKGKFLPKLYINGFDAEQIWQQCDLLNKASLSNLAQTVRNIDIKDISHAVSKINKVALPATNVDSKITCENGDDFSDAGSNNEEEYAFDDDSDSPTEMEAIINKKSDVKEKEICNDGSDSPTEMEAIIRKKSDVKEKKTSNDDSDSPTEMEAIIRKKTLENETFDDDFSDDSDSPTTEMEAIIRKKTLENETSDDDFSDDSDSPTTEMEKANSKEPPVKRKKISSSSRVDDQFFKLSELEEFLKVQDLKEEKNIERDSDDDDDIDLFQDIPSDDMEDSDDEEGVKPLKSSKDVMYADFFDAPESEGDVSDGNMHDYDESMMEEDNETSFHENDSTVKMRDDLEIEKNYDSEAESEISDKNKNLLKTAFQLEQEKIRKKIQEYEKSMIEPLPWHLTGEVDATNRPIDSLIHKETDFDSNVKEDLIVDNVLTENIEAIVRMAIINKAFNDVERKYKPTEDIIAYKKEKVLEQTKSKKSLAQVYEDEYLKKQNKQNEEVEDPKHKEIKKLMDSLFPELYALFSHIPVPAIPDIKIVSNLPAVTVEEVAPVTMNDATLLAPEEVKKKSGQIKNQTERTDTDRKRERRKKKVHQKLKEQKRLAKLESQKGNPSAKVTKLEKLQTIKKLKQHKNTRIATVDEGGKIKSSKDFFSRLQDTMDTKTRNKSENFFKKKKK